MELTDAAKIVAEIKERYVPGCRLCDLDKKGEFVPTHRGSRYCQSGSIASGGRNAHCTCDGCF